MNSYQVLIAGAGPVGLTLAIDLGRRGVRCLLVERNAAPGRLPKMERCNARTMEIYRRLGLADRIREAGYPSDHPMDVFIVNTMAEAPILHLPYPSVAQLKALAREVNDGSQPLEPYQLISQYTLEPLLKSVVEEIPGIEVRFACEFVRQEQDAQGVTCTLRGADGRTEQVRVDYLVGCDGGASAVRKQLGIALQGEGNIMQLRQALFRCPGLYERIPIGRGRHYHIADALHTQVVVQDDCEHFTLHSKAERDEDMPEIFRRAVGLPIEFETLYVGQWTQHLLLAERYAEGRVLLAGDAAHLVIPTGGLGMNTGVGDATDLAWKLAGTLQGWGGSQLLASYASERRQIGARNVQASRAASQGRRLWRAAWRPEVADDTPQGRRARDDLARVADVEQRKSNELLGIEMGYRYIGSALVAQEPGTGPDPDSFTYVPTTWPGARLPHAWLDDGSALFDHLGNGYTLLRLGNAPPDTAALEHALRALGAPLDVLTLPDAQVHRIYGRALLLLRPDLHIAWRGDVPPADATRLAAMATGH